MLFVVWASLLMTQLSCVWRSVESPFGGFDVLTRQIMLYKWIRCTGINDRYKEWKQEQRIKLSTGEGGAFLLKKKQVDSMDKR